MIGFMPYAEVKNEEVRYEVVEGEDMICLADGMVFPAMEEGINHNTLVVGATRSGKSTSVLLPSVLHTYHSSMVIPIVKRKIYEQCAPVLKDRGYDVILLDLAKLERGQYGYDPMRSAKTEDDLLSLAGTIVSGSSRTLFGDSDPYWSNCTTSAIAAMMMLVRFMIGEKAGFGDVMEMYKQMDVSYTTGHCRTSLDMDFAKMEDCIPASQAPKLWQTIAGNAARTASCVISMIHSALSKFCGEYGVAVFGKKKQVNFASIGKKKTVLFVVYNNTSVPGKQLMNILMSDLIKQLFEQAESNGGELKIPVTLYFDDFACGAKVENMVEYISSFCAAGISATILLQSMSQLDAIYGHYDSCIVYRIW